MHRKIFRATGFINTACNSHIKIIKKNSSAVLIPEIQNIERLLSNNIFIHWQDKNNMLGLIKNHT